jgi:hypothetical protein
MFEDMERIVTLVLTSLLVACADHPRPPPRFASDDFEPAERAHVRQR